MSSPLHSFSSPALHAQAVTKDYPNGATVFRALKGVDFQAARGEFVMLAGPSGSGKTTLLSIMGCVLSPSSGSVRLLGQEVAGRSQAELADVRRTRIGFIFQGHNLIASMSAEENVALVLELRGIAVAQAKRTARALLERVGLAQKFASKPSDLSGGQRQRVAIARALAGAPPLILADEPTASLDAQNGLLISELLRQMAKELNHTVVVVTHDNRIFHLADRIVQIEDGLILPSEHPATKRIAARVETTQIAEGSSL